MSTATVRPAALAGSFYPASPEVLRQDVQLRLQRAQQRVSNQGLAPKMLIVPHAGHVYSGNLAALAYASLGAGAAQLERVVILAPAHRVAFDGLALPGVDAMATPLGDMPLDGPARQALATLPTVSQRADVHAQEHAVEVHLPFLQVLTPKVKLVPLVVGRATGEQVAQAIDLLWGGPETLIVISSDLSHFHAYEDAQRLDRDTLQRILRLQRLSSHQQACGATPINGAIEVAKRRGLRPQELGLMNSGDTPRGDRQRVVGYGAVAFVAATQVNREQAGQTLLQLARDSIEAKLSGAPAMSRAWPEWLQHPGASFVTLTIGGQLRGCIGSLQAHRRLLDDVRHNAVAAATQDPRFKPLTPAEWARTRIEVSLLSTPQPLRFSDEADALRQVQAGRHGVILSHRSGRSTFLPQVWAQLPDKAQFWAQLKRKAGWAPEFWAPDMQVSVYTVTEWHEADPASTP